MVSYCEEIAQNGLIAALVGRPWHRDRRALRATASVLRVGCGCQYHFGGRFPSTVFLSSAVSYCEENAQNGPIAALIRRPWHCDGPEGFIGCFAVFAQWLVPLSWHYGSDKLNKVHRTHYSSSRGA